MSPNNPGGPVYTAKHVLDVKLGCRYTGSAPKVLHTDAFAKDRLRSTIYEAGSLRRYCTGPRSRIDMEPLFMAPGHHVQFILLPTDPFTQGVPASTYLWEDVAGHCVTRGFRPNHQPHTPMTDPSRSRRQPRTACFSSAGSLGALVTATAATWGPAPPGSAGPLLPGCMFGRERGVASRRKTGRISSQTPPPPPPVRLPPPPPPPKSPTCTASPPPPSPAAAAHQGKAAAAAAAAPASRFVPTEPFWEMVGKLKHMLQELGPEAATIVAAAASDVAARGYEELAAVAPAPAPASDGCSSSSNSSEDTSSCGRVVGSGCSTPSSWQLSYSWPDYLRRSCPGPLGGSAPAQVAPASPASSCSASSPAFRALPASLAAHYPEGPFHPEPRACEPAPSLPTSPSASPLGSWPPGLNLPQLQPAASIPVTAELPLSTLLLQNQHDTHREVDAAAARTATAAQAPDTSSSNWSGSLLGSCFPQQSSLPCTDSPASHGAQELVEPPQLGCDSVPLLPAKAGGEPSPREALCPEGAPPAGRQELLLEASPPSWYSRAPYSLAF